MIPKSQQQIQLSPLNYIKAKSRSLPIYKCYINEFWQTQGMASIIVIRQHPDGKFLFASYLVDLYALGTKNTFFNISQTQQQIDDLLSRDNFIEIDYNTIHNIIYGGNQFAEDNNFKIHKDFKKITQYMLEIDDDTIPFIDIEFGKFGKPLIMSGFTLNYE